MLSTIEWAQSLNIPTETVIRAEIGNMPVLQRTAQDIAVRTVVLQGVVAVACGVDPKPVITWFEEQQVWNMVTPREKAFLLLSQRSKEQCNYFRCHQEAEWTLLWMIGKVVALGLPTHYCDTRRLVDEIIPALGSDIQPFIESATLQHFGDLFAENDRTYDMWCYYWRDQRENKPLPHDLNVTLLYERRYAFEWLDGIQEWDDVTCDA